MITTKDDSKYLWLFFVITYAFSWAFWIPGALAAHGVSLPKGIVNFLNSPFNPAAFGPLISAFVLTFFQQGGKGVAQLLKRGANFRFKKIWLVAILLLPLIIFGGGILLSILTGATQPDYSIISNPAYALIAFFVILFTGGPLQEEYGWRGYALPRLQSRNNAIAASVILGVFWWLWHLPLVFIPGRFMADNSLLFVALSIEIVLTSVLFTWIYNNTKGSVLATMLLHTSMNWSIWLFLPGMTTNLFIIGFTVVLLAITVLGIIRIRGAARLSQVSEA